MERLNRALARAGVCSRRGADALIREGRVTVNGETVSDAGRRVDPSRDAVKLDGRRVLLGDRPFHYYMLHKPAGCVTTLADPEGRPTVRDLLGEVGARLFPVGRLDFNTEGLLLFTDDGELAQRLTHPRHGVAKTYMVKVRGRPDAEALERLRRGVVLDGRRTGPARVRVVRPGANAWLEVVVHEGRKHQVRRMLESQGHRVVRLRRTRFDGLELGDLPPGRARRLTPSEIDRLRSATLPGGPRTSRAQSP